MHVLSFLILQNFYVIIALKYVSYAVLLGIEEEITSEPEPVASKASRPLTVMFYNASFVRFDTKEFQKNRGIHKNQNPNCSTVCGTGRCRVFKKIETPKLLCYICSLK
jgi:hypothetical protein